MPPDQFSDIKHQLSDITERLIKLETKIGERCEKRMCQMLSLEKRIRHLENRSAMLTGGLVVVPMLINWLLKFI